MSRINPILATASLALVGILAVVACSKPTATPLPTQTPVKTAGPTSTTAPLPTTLPTVTPGGLPTATKPAGTAVAPALTLNVTQPQSESIVTSNLIQVKGQTTPDAIVSVNGIIIKTVDASGGFTAAVPLQEGPNLVEIVASDYLNNQVSQTLTVIYTP